MINYHCNVNIVAKHFKNKKKSLKLPKNQTKKIEIDFVLDFVEIYFMVKPINFYVIIVVKNL